MDFVFDVIFGLLLELFKAVCPDYELKKWQSALNLLVYGLSRACCVSNAE